MWTRKGKVRIQTPQSVKKLIGRYWANYHFLYSPVSQAGALNS